MLRASGTPRPSSNAIRKLLGHLGDLVNPLRISQSGNTDCFSCHMVDQTLLELEKKGLAENLPLASFPRAPVWANFNPRKRSFLNFRNFGYETGFEFGVAERTLLETHQDLKILRQP